MTDKALLSKIKQAVTLRAPSAQVYLFGSRATGKFTPESDWDLLILLDQEELSLAQEQNITNALYDIELETGAIISPSVYTSNEWANKYSVTAFYESVMQSAVPI